MVSYTLGGKDGHQISLREAQDLVVIRFKEKSCHSLEEAKLSPKARSVTQNLILISSFPEANVAVYKCMDSSGKTAKTLRNEVRKVLKEEKKAVRFAGRTLVDDHGILHLYLYTENLFVKFHDKTTKKLCKEILKKHKLKIKEEVIYAKNGYFVEAATGTGMKVFEIAQKLLKNKNVEACHPELVKHRKMKTISPRQWHLKKTKVSNRTIDAHVDVTNAWKITKGEKTIIAVIDDGIDIDHPEFKGRGKVVAPRDMMLKSDDPRPKFEDDNHGTACAGVACGNGSSGASGVAPGSKLMPIRLRAGLGSMREADAFAWAASNNADVISCSWGPPDGAWWDPDDPRHAYYVPMPDATRYAINYALQNGRDGKGCVIVWAAGNGRENVEFDGYASHPEVIAVAASNDTNRRSVYSDFGKEIWCCFLSGDFGYQFLNHPKPLTSGIWTTDRLGDKGYNPGSSFINLGVGDKSGNYTATFGGTSSSTPGVAGIAALMLSVNPELKYWEVKELMRSSCDKIDNATGRYNEDGHSVFYGYGKLNATKAVNNARNTSQEVAELSVDGYVEFSKTGNVVFKDKVLLTTAQKREKFIGISIKVQPFHPELIIQYRLVFNKIGKTDWAENGAFLSAKDRRRKCIGIAIKLQGSAADKYKLNYRGKFKGKKKWQEGSDGSYIGKASGTGAAIEKLEIDLIIA